MATEPPVAAPLCITSTLSVHGAEAPEIVGNYCFDLVIVEPHGRGPQGFRYRIVLDSATRGARSTLDLSVEEDGLIVAARDVDGTGNDLDLIIKSAWSFTPVGVWINDHQGGFTKADAGIYAPSISSDGPLMLSLNLPDTWRGAILLWHESCTHPSTQPYPGERGTSRYWVARTDLNVASRLSMQASQTRGPPSSFLTDF